MSGGLHLPSLVGDDDAERLPEQVDAAFVRAHDDTPKLLRWSDRTAASVESFGAPPRPGPHPRRRSPVALSRWPIRPRRSGPGPCVLPKADRALLVADWIVVASGMRGNRRGSDHAGRPPRRATRDVSRRERSRARGQPAVGPAAAGLGLCGDGRAHGARAAAALWLSGSCSHRAGRGRASGSCPPLNSA